MTDSDQEMKKISDLKGLKFRPSQDSVLNMNKEMIRLWNETVKPEDTVYLNGDFGFAPKNKLIEVLERLNGQKHLNLGNHDQEIIKNRSDFLHEKRFLSIRDYRELTVEGHKIRMFHYGCRVWEGSHRGTWLLYGHSHNTLPPQGKSVDVGVDSTPILGYAPYRPFSFQEVKSFLDKQQIVNNDHHSDNTQ